MISESTPARNNSFDAGPLSWVMDEIREALARSKAVLTAIPAEDGVDRATTLRQARTHLHQAHGALQMVDLDGVSTLTQAVEELFDKLLAQDTENADTPATEQKEIDAIVGAYQAVTEYLDELLAGSPHQPVRLYPYYQAVRDAAGIGRVHPSELFFPDLGIRPQLPLASQSTAPFNYLFLRQRFEKALLPYLRSTDPNTDVAAAVVMAELVGEAERAQTVQEGRALWWVLRGFAEVASSGEIRNEVFVKQLFGRINMHVRALANGALSRDGNLLRDALFFIAGSALPSPRVQQVRVAYQLEGMVPPDYQQKRYGQVDSAAVALAREKLNLAKALWNRIAGGDLAAGSNFVREMSALSDAGARLNVPPFSRLLAELNDISARVALEDPAAAAGTLGVEIAASLLFVENALNHTSRLAGSFADRAEALATRLTALVAGKQPEATTQWLDEMSRHAQQKQTMTALANEMQSSLGQVEKMLDEYFGNPTRRTGLPLIDTVLHQIEGALHILDQDDAVHAVQHIRRAVQSFAAADVDVAPDEQEFHQVARNVGALSFFIETLQLPSENVKKRFSFDAEQGVFHANMLEKESRMLDVSVSPPEEAELDPSAELATAVPSSPGTLITGIESPATSGEADSNAAPLNKPDLNEFMSKSAPETPPLLRLDATDANSANASRDTPDTPDTADTADTADTTDTTDTTDITPAAPERVDSTDIPAVATPSPEDAGIGEPIGAQDLTSGMAISKAAISAGEPLDLEFDLSSSWQAGSALSNDDPFAAVQQEFDNRPAMLPRVVPALTPTFMPADDEAVDAELLEIFLGEAVEVLQCVHDTIPQLVARPDDQECLTTLRRAFHTLKGSGRMVGLVAFGEGAWSVEQVLNFRLSAGEGGSPEVTGLLTKAAEVLGIWVADLQSQGTSRCTQHALVLAAERVKNGGDFIYENSQSRIYDDDQSLEIEPPSATTGADTGAGTEPEWGEAEASDLTQATILPAFAATPPLHDGPSDLTAFDELASGTKTEEPDASFGESDANAEAQAEEWDAKALMSHAFTESVEISGLPDSGHLVDSVPEFAELDEFDAGTRESSLAELSNSVATPPIISADAFTGTSERPAEETPDLPGQPAEQAQAAPVSAAPVEHDRGAKVFGFPEPAGESSARDDNIKRIGDIEISVPLHNIYLAETDELVRLLAQDFSDWRHESERNVNVLAVHAAHSLAGSSATVGFAVLHDVAHALETVLQTLDRKPSALMEVDHDLLEQSVVQMKAMLKSFALGEMPGTEPDMVLALRHLCDAIVKRGGNADPEAEFDYAAFSRGEVALGEHPLAPEAASPQEAALEEEFDPVSDVDTVPSSQIAVMVADDLDADLLPVFLEEGSDILPQLGRLLRIWQNLPSDSAPVASMLRLLHTIKGSARMAGAMALGQHMHEMESRIEQIGYTGGTRVESIEELLGRFDYALYLFEQLQQDGSSVSPRMHHVGRRGTRAIDGASLFRRRASDRVAEAIPEAGSISHADRAAVEAAATDGAGGTLPVATPATTSLAIPPTTAAATPEAKPTGIATATPVTTLAHDGALGTAVAVSGQTPMVRVRADILDRLVNQAGEVSISRSRIETEMQSLRQSLMELTENVSRLRGQLREIEIQAESQMASQMAQSTNRDFDPLEFDRFTRLQELTRMMAESVNDVASVQQNLSRTVDHAGTDLGAQARLTRDLQQDLMRVRMVQFASVSERLYRVTRQASKEVDKRVNLDIRGGAVEMDRSVLEKMAGPFEHLLRNAIVHGIESRQARIAAGKSETGELLVEIRQEGNEVQIRFCDDGQGIDLDRIRQKARDTGLLKDGADMTDTEVRDLIFHPGFSTAQEVTELAGRGVGMDVVRAEAAALGGRIQTFSEPGKGATFVIQLPLTLAVTQVVLVTVGARTYAVPSVLVEQVQQLKAQALAGAYNEGSLPWQGSRVALHYLPALLGDRQTTPVTQQYSPVMILKSGNDSVAIHVDEVIGNREVVVKNIGPQLARMIGIAGATVLGSGDIVLILDPVPLAQHVQSTAGRASQLSFGDVSQEIGAVAEIMHPDGPGNQGSAAEPVQGLRAQSIVMVVDDSLTVRRVTQRLLAREGYQVVLAKDGVDALEQLQAITPDIMLVDIEMPRMDGFDLTRNVRGDSRTRAIPIIMITSRTAEKHRNYAMELGVNEYVGKPYQETELLRLVEQYLKAESTVS
jgi:chemosensory pili system protein ChpA (sensor histidine kinase/response regulator)